MQIEQLGTVILTNDPVRDATFFVEHFGFVETVRLAWYVSLKHPDLERFCLDLLGHVPDPAGIEGQLAATENLLLGFRVPDAGQMEEYCRAKGLTIVKPLTDEPWGQRRFQVKAPGGIVEVLQTIPPDPEWLSQQAPA